MWTMTSNDVRVNWAEVIRHARHRNGVTIAKAYRTEVAAVVPIDWYREAVKAIGEPQLVGDEPPSPDQKPAAGSADS